MKRFITLCLGLMVFMSSAFAGEPVFTPRKAFSNLGIAASVSTSGVGITLATPVAKRFVLRGGYMFSPFSYGYTYDDFAPIDIPGGKSVSVPDLDIDANMQFGNAHFMVDWVPFKKGTGSFFVTAGLFIGQGKVINIDGQFDMSDPNIQTLKQHGLLNEIEVEVGDQIIRADDSGYMNAALKVNGLRPYVGLGWGRAIPKHRFGFRFEMGAIMLGQSSIESDNIINANSSSEISEFNELLNKIKVYPQISFALTYRIFKE